MEVSKDTLEVLCESFDTLTEQDQKVLGLSDVVVLEVGGVQIAVVTDNNNSCIKSFFTNNTKKCHSRLQLNDSPWRIAKLGGNKVMVTVPFANQIVTVAVTPDLVYENHIDTGKRYFSLAVMSPSRLAASGWDGIDIMNMQGEVLKSISTRLKRMEFSRPWYMSVNHMAYLLVSDWGKKTVTCMTSSGHTVWVYSGKGEQLRSLEGIDITGNGDILVADKYSSKVVQLSKSGEYVKDILTSEHGLNEPKGICVDKNGSLFLCDSGKLLKFTFL